MKKWLLPLAIGLALSGTAGAQDAKPAQDAAPAAAAAAPATATAATLPAALAAAVADPGRADDAQVDARRHGGEILAFADVKPGDKVLELLPGGGYFTRLLSKTVGADGKVYAEIPTEIENADRFKAVTDKYPNVALLRDPAAAPVTPESVDVAFTSQNYHDYPTPYLGNTDVADVDRHIFSALKPGGLYIVIDHVAEAGSGTRDTDTLHRIDPAFVRKQVEAAGFEFVGESDVLRNPADDHTLKVFDKAIRGHTDQFVYKFRKQGSPSAR
jgi:predicted methyltransferase